MVVVVVSKEGKTDAATSSKGDCRKKRECCKAGTNTEHNLLLIRKSRGRRKGAGVRSGGDTASAAVGAHVVLAWALLGSSVACFFSLGRCWTRILLPSRHFCCTTRVLWRYFFSGAPLPFLPRPPASDRCPTISVTLLRVTRIPTPWLACWCPTFYAVRQGRRAPHDACDKVLPLPCVPLHGHGHASCPEQSTDIDGGLGRGTVAPPQTSPARLPATPEQATSQRTHPRPRKQGFPQPNTPPNERRKGRT